MHPPPREKAFRPGLVWAISSINLDSNPLLDNRRTKAIPMSKSKVTKCLCNECCNETKHKILHESKRDSPSDANDPTQICWMEDCSLLECCGCGAICLVNSFSYSEGGQNYGPETYYFPPRELRNKPNWLTKLPSEYFPLLHELYSSLHAGNRTLAMMGARTVLDIFIANKVGDQGNFKNGLDALVKSNYLAQMNRAVIEAAIEAGNAAAHRAYNPPPEQLNAVMDIVENLIQHDVLVASAANLKSKVPGRPRAPKKKKEGATP